MRYLSIELFRYKPFRFSKIEKIILKTTSDIQTIIGANGSGKSALLREISPLPANRPNYGPDGYKSVVLLHETDVYTLTSDFSNKTSPHSFKKNEEELNDGGTTSVQEDLVQKHLGYTKIVEDITTGGIKFSSMAPGARKSLLMAISPYNLGFVLEEHRRIASEIRACKNNLSMLVERKASLEAEMVDQKEIDELIKEREGLDLTLNEMVEYTHRAKELLSALEFADRGELLENVDFSALHKEILTFQRNSVLWTSVSRSDPSGQETQLTREQFSTEGRVANNEDRLKELLSEINYYQSELAIDDNNTPASISSEIKSITAKIAAIDPDSLLDESEYYSEPQIKALKEVSPEIEEICTYFVACPDKLIGSVSLQRKELLLKRRRFEVDVVSSEVSRLRGQHTELLSRIKIKPSDIPDSPCAKMACPLFTIFMTQSSKRLTEISDLEKEISRHSVRLSRLRSYVSGVTAQLKTMDQYIPYIRRLSRIVMDFPELKKCLPEDTILESLQSAPTTIFRRNCDLLEESEKFHEHEKLKKALEEKLSLKAQMDKISMSEQDLIKKSLAKKEIAASDLNKKLIEDAVKLVNIEQKLSFISQYRDSVSRLEEMRTLIEGVTNDSRASYEQSILTEAMKTLSDVKNKCVSRIGEIDHTLRSQETLLQRYQLEVLNQIKDVEKKKIELTHVEAALSPATGIPHVYSVSFINRLIGIVNYYISAVFSYSFSLVPVSVTDPVDYKFSANVGDVTIPEISGCSAAQSEMIDLAFSLALINILKLKDYPIFLDEAGKTFDHHHRHQLLSLLQLVLDDETVSSIFMVNHNEAVLGGLPNSEVLVLNDLNIVVPEVFNTHASFEHFV